MWTYCSTRTGILQFHTVLASMLYRWVQCRYFYGTGTEYAALLVRVELYTGGYSVGIYGTGTAVRNMRHYQLGTTGRAFNSIMHLARILPVRFYRRNHFNAPARGCMDSAARRAGAACWRRRLPVTGQAAPEQ